MVVQFDTIGVYVRAGWRRNILAELYIQMLSAKSNPRADVLLKNAWVKFGTIISGANPARTLPKKAATVKI
jgi:hypothetical protein